MKKVILRFFTLIIATVLLASSLTGCALLLYEAFTEDSSQESSNTTSNQNEESNGKTIDSTKQPNIAEQESEKAVKAEEPSQQNPQSNDSVDTPTTSPDPQETADETNSQSGSDVPAPNSYGEKNEATISSEESKPVSTPISNDNNKSEPASQNLENEEKVWITPSGKRYHATKTCGGKNSYEVTLTAAKKKGLTPCSKCW